MKQAKNPIFPSNEYIPDPEAHVFGNRVYIYGSHDEFNGTDYCENDYVAYSAPVNDLSDWKFEGVIYRKNQHPNVDDLGNLFAPDVSKGPDGKYYLYYILQKSNTISVAICDTPAGEYEYYGEVRYEDGHIAGSDKEEYAEFDVAILNDNGKYYLYSGTGQKENQALGYPVVGLFVRELASDMVTLKTKPKILMGFDDDRSKPNFFEGASISKFNNKYYLLYFGTDFVGLHYCISDYPDKDFVYGGLIHSAMDIGYEGRTKEDPVNYINNNHGSLQEINGQLYVFNHRTANRKPFSRQAIAEPIDINEDGSIHQVESTSTGLNNGPFTIKEIFPAYIACNYFSSVIDSKRSPDRAPYPTQEMMSDGITRQYVTDLHNESIIGFKYFHFEEESQKIKLKVRGKAEGSIKITTEENVETSNISEVLISIDSKHWVEVESSIIMPKEEVALYFKFIGTGNLDLLSFEIE